MEFVKTFCVTAQLWCAIRVDFYGCTLDYIMKLFEEARKDFPHLTPALVEVQECGGENHCKYGIRFRALRGCEVPASYVKVDEAGNPI